MTIELYSASTGNGRRPIVMLEECGLAYKLHKLDLAKGESKKPEFLTINPAGAIPALVDSDGPGGKPITLSQSAAILLYLADKTGKFIPKDAAGRAATYQWLMQAVTDVAPASSAIFYASAYVPEKSAANSTFFEQRLLNNLAVDDKRLGDSEYLAGSEITVADLALYPVVAGRMALIDKTPGLTNLKRWAAMIAARPAVQKAMQAV